MFGVIEIVAFVLGVVIGFIVAGLSVFVLMQMGNAGIPYLSNFANILGNWSITWFPIILLIGAASVIIALLIRRF